MTQEYLIALGSNMVSQSGDRTETLTSALGMLAEHVGQIRRVSRFFSTPCFPAGAGPDYVNACVSLSAAANPDDLIKKLHNIEKIHGRVRKNRWGSRTLDLDLLACGDRISPDLNTFEQWRALPLDQQMTHAPDQLILPHPRLHERAFVLVPLVDIAPDWRHPILRQNVTKMLQDLDKNAIAEVVPLTQCPPRDRIT